MGSLNLEHKRKSPLNAEEFRKQGHMMIEFIANYYENLEKYPVLSQVQPNYLRRILPTSAPYDPESVEAILEDVQNHIIPGLTHWQSPNYFGYFPSSHSVAGFLGEMLTSGFDVVGFNWMSSPAATELESIVMDWLGQMLQLPKSFLFSGNGGGVMQSTTCEAILCTLVAARDQMLTQIGRENMDKLVVYGSDQTHSTLKKASQIAGIHPTNFSAISTNISTSFTLSSSSLKSAILSDIEAGLVPLFLCATVGTTSTTAVDPLQSLCDVAKEFNIWVHVDAAYAGSACICPEFRHFINGVEGANSFSFNAHKWFFTTLDCCCLWVKNPNALIKSLSTNPEYLRNKASDDEQVVDYKDWQITLSRRFRSLKLWLVLRSYGIGNLRKFLRSHVAMAKMFEGFVASDNRFELVVPRNFALVCFRLSVSTVRKYYKNMCSLNGEDDHEMKILKLEECVNEVNRKLLERVNKSGDIFMTHSIAGGIHFIRFSVGASLTEDEHVIKAWKVIQQHATALLSF